MTERVLKSTLSRGEQIEDAFHRLKAQEWATSPLKAQEKIDYALMSVRDEFIRERKEKRKERSDNARIIAGGKSDDPWEEKNISLKQWCKFLGVPKSEKDFLEGFQDELNKLPAWGWGEGVDEASASFGAALMLREIGISSDYFIWIDDPEVKISLNLLATEADSVGTIVKMRRLIDLFRAELDIERFDEEELNEKKKHLRGFISELSKLTEGDSK